MAFFDKFAKGFSMAVAYIAYISLTLMMLFVGVAAVARALHKPIIGDIEIVQLGMVILIAGALAYTEYKNGHVEVGIIVDHFPSTIQKILNIFSLVLTVIFSLTVAYAFYTKFDAQHSSVLLGYKFYPLKILLIIGFIAWALMAIQKITVLLRMKGYEKWEE